jgi:hypothetical protein
MILFAILVIMAAIILSLTIFTVGTVGAAGIILFAEPIICIALIILIIKLIRKRKNKD